MDQLHQRSWNSLPNDEFGDFQTPLELAKQCLNLLHIAPNARILEPTCGKGTFLQAAAEVAPGSERVGIEVNESYAETAQQWGAVSVANIFETNLARDLTWRTDEDLVVIGNPPWITSAQLNRLDSANLPPKENFKGAKGLDALLGSSNFDVCEYVLLKVLKELAGRKITMGMLCKTQVARNVLKHAADMDLPLAGARVHRIDAMRWFEASVDACWFVVTLDPALSPDYTAAVHEDISAPNAEPSGRFGVVDGVFVSNVDKYQSVRDADGTSPYSWRSGMKHDASAVFELTAQPHPVTKDGQTPEVEDGFIFPLLKCTDIFRGRHLEQTKWVIVPQQTFGADTNQLSSVAPNLWRYLTANATALDGRKSSIYKNRPRFSVFGHGPYTYAKYKVAISGLHKEPRFRLVPPLNGLPVVLDDTCYFTAFDDPTEACIATALLSSPECVALIESLVFWDSKRPITKKLLQRLDTSKLPRDEDSIITSAHYIAREASVELDEEKARNMLQLFGTEPDSFLF